MPLGDLEDLVRTALDCGLIGPEARRTLMRGLPMGFVYSLPTVSRPIDQLRFDLMELERTPRLIGLDRPPLAVWLSNAADKTATEGKADAARLFAARADAIYPSAGVAQRIEKQLGQAAADIAPQSSHHPPAPTSTSGIPRPASPPRSYVLALDRASGDGWKTIDPPIDPIKVFDIDIPPGDWPRTKAPHTTPWRLLRDAIDEAIGKLADLARPGDGLSVFIWGVPPVMAMLLGSRLRQRLPFLTARFYDRVRSRGRSGWRLRGPWATSVPTPDERTLDVDFDGIGAELREVALTIELDRFTSPEALPEALASLGPAGRLRVRPTRRGRDALATSARVEGALAEVATTIDDLRARAPGVRRLHLIYRGPAAFAARIADELLECGIEVTAYTEQTGGHVPAVEFAPGVEAKLASPPLPGSAADAPYDVFLIYGRADEATADALYEALTRDRGLRVFLDARSLLPGDTWDRAVPAAIAKSRLVLALIGPAEADGEAWYEKELVVDGIEHARRGAGGRRMIPVLLPGSHRAALHYGLRRLKAIEVPARTPPAQIPSCIIEALDPLLPARGPAEAGPAPPTASPGPSSDDARPAPRPRTKRPGPLKILFLAADPGRRDRQVLSDEMRAIDQAIRMNGMRKMVVLASRNAVRTNELRRALREEEPDILHFAGHGDKRGLHLIDPDTARPVAFKPEALAEILALSAHPLRGVVLTVPDSAAIADALVGTVDFAIGIEGTPTEKARRDLAGAFYDEVTAGEPLARAFHACEAMFSSRHGATGRPRLRYDSEAIDPETLTLVEG